MGVAAVTAGPHGHMRASPPLALDAANLALISWLIGTVGEGGPKAIVIPVGEPAADCLWAAARSYPLYVRVMCASADPSGVPARPRMARLPSGLRR